MSNISTSRVRTYSISNCSPSLFYHTPKPLARGKGILNINKSKLINLDRSNRILTKQIHSAKLLIQQAVLSANEIAPGIPLHILPSFPVNKPSSPSKTISRCPSSSPSQKGVNYISLNKQALWKLKSSSKTPTKDISWVKSIRSAAIVQMNNKNWRNTREVVVTPDNVDVSKIKDEVRVSPVHRKCGSCSRNKLPLVLRNPTLNKIVRKDINENSVRML